MDRKTKILENCGFENGTPTVQCACGVKSIKKINFVKTNKRNHFIEVKFSHFELLFKFFTLEINLFKYTLLQNCYYNFVLKREY